MYYGQISYQDLKQFNPLIGKTFFEEGEGNFKGMIRTYYMRWNAFANKITPAVSNWHHGNPPEGAEPYHPKIMSAVMTAQPLHHGEFY